MINCDGSQSPGLLYNSPTQGSPVSYMGSATNDTPPHQTFDEFSSERCLAEENRMLAFQALFHTLGCPCMKHHREQLSSTVFPYLVHTLSEHAQSIQPIQSRVCQTSDKNCDGHASAGTEAANTALATQVLQGDVVSVDVKQSRGDAECKHPLYYENLSAEDWISHHLLQQQDTSSAPSWLNSLHMDERPKEVQNSDVSKFSARDSLCFSSSSSSCSSSSNAIALSDIDVKKGAESEIALAAAKCLVRMLRHPMLSSELLTDSGLIVIMTQLLKLSASPPLKQVGANQSKVIMFIRGLPCVSLLSLKSGQIDITTHTFCLSQQVAVLILFNLCQHERLPLELEEEYAVQHYVDNMPSSAASEAPDYSASNQRLVWMCQMLNSGALGTICQCLLPPAGLDNVQCSLLKTNSWPDTSSRQEEHRFTSEFYVLENPWLPFAVFPIFYYLM
jgi:hypothetical protein